ncbi:LamG-like jellyroll fold domain-containing protein [Salmonirosea aquatica]|uniref:T9SS type B sorting domain-containing protein n=1 Tax=Salmonirosea aquatica TaxID=2654236 RepID=A0A7C9BK50_9BACT|nr:T9SS type B sorting domain-containing protein [Cytophagaceae bacterium SJW1-29]
MKSVFYSLLFLFFCPDPTNAQVDLNKGLIGCYPFAGNANDLSPSQNHGKVTGAVLTEDRFGAKNSAYYFDGVDDFIEINSKILLLNTFSYSLWVSPESLPAIGIAFFLISVGSDYGDQHILLGNQYTNGYHNAFSHGSYQGVAQNVRCTNDQVPQTQRWYHLVLTKDDDNYYMYLDGKLICSNPVIGKKAFYGTTTPKAIIGARNNYGQASNAKIDDVHLYDRALSESEVLELFKGNTPTNPVELTISNSNPCAGETIVASANIGTNAILKWRVDSAFIQSESARSVTVSLPDQTTDYEISIKADIIPDSTVCFPEKPQSISKTILIKYCPPPPTTEPTKLLIPSAFTPNDDGHNDELKIYNWEAINGFEIYIYDRWGEVIFYSKGYEKPWNGRYKEKAVPSGIYLIKVFSNKKQINSATVTIIN